MTDHKLKVHQIPTNTQQKSYSLRSEILVLEMVVSRLVLVLDTTISKTSISERRDYITWISKRPLY